MCLTDKIFLQTHVTFCEYLVFHEFKRNLYITLAKYLEQEGIAIIYFSICLYTVFLSSALIHEMIVVGYWMISQKCFSLHLV